MNCFIQLTGKHGKGKFTIVDKDDFDYLIQYKWRARKRGKKLSAITTIKNKDHSMHRMIMGYPEGLEIDHKNREPLDNRRENLRVCNRFENMRNIGPKSNKTHSIYKGIKKNNKTYLWQVRLNSEYLGCCETELDAAEHYDYFALQKYGEFSCLNFPQKDYSEFKPNFKTTKKLCKYFGVSKSSCGYNSQCFMNGKRHYLGHFKTEEEAAIVRDEFVKSNNLDRKLNFP